MGERYIGVEGRGFHVLDWSLATLGIGTADTLAAWGGGGDTCDAGNDARWGWQADDAQAAGAAVEFKTCAA